MDLDFLVRDRYGLSLMCRQIDGSRHFEVSLVRGSRLDVIQIVFSLLMKYAKKLITTAAAQIKVIAVPGKKFT